MKDDLAREPLTLANCDREPIHIPGAIQGHGLLAACQDDFVVTQVSANVESFLDRAPGAVLGTDLTSWLMAPSAELFTQAGAQGFPRDLNPIGVVAASGRRYDALIHRQGAAGPVIVEFEPADHQFSGWDPRVRRSVRRFQQATDIDALLDLCAREVRELTAFDRVMIYRFDADWNGRVEAEARDDRLEPFKGLHYPAADIPAQARRLYELNWLRIIPDVGYTPVALSPVVNPVTGSPLDLSFAVLRSVSPIHVQYLQNMGVTASMSVSLIYRDRLIGLIACHHYSGPRRVPYVTRETCEYLGQMMSWHLARLDAQETTARTLATHRAQADVVSAVATAPSIPAGLMDPAMLALTDASGAAVVYEGRVAEIGRTPGELRIRQLVHFLSQPGIQGTFTTDRLSDHMPATAHWDDTAAGVLAVDISREFGEFILWFRQATERVVHWGGDPRAHGSVVPDASGAPRLSPRGSFALWREVVRGRSLPWEPWQVEAAERLRTLLLGKFRERAVELRTMNARLEAADRAKDEFISTVSHELRTPLNGMLGWLRLLQTGSIDAEQRQRALATIERNARAQAKLIEDLLDVSRIMSGKLTLNVEAVLIAAVVDQAIETVRPAAASKDLRLQTTMDSTAAVMGDAGRLVQVLTNLLSNAVKFTPRQGRVQVLVERRESSVDVSVADTGQGIDPEFLPHVFERFRQADVSTARRTGGLGLGLAIARQIVEMHGGSIAALSDGIGRGATFSIRLPLSIAMRREVAAPHGASTPPGLGCPPGLKDLKVLVVDDEPDARDLLQTVFAGCRANVRTAGSAADALALMDSFVPDVLVSDIGMPEMDGYQFMTAVRRRPAERGGRTPAVALTAYARIEDRTRALVSGFQVHVPKPVEPVEILAVVASLASVNPLR
ncbi:MAG: ATP-binding protein [Vicinamibacterales bacterium]